MTCCGLVYRSHYCVDSSWTGCGLVDVSHFQHVQIESLYTTCFRFVVQQFVQQLHTFNGPFFGTTQVSRYQKGKTYLDFTEARDIEWQSHQLGHMQVCTSLQTDNHTSTPPLSFLQTGCPFCRPTDSVKALKAKIWTADRNSGVWAL